MVQRVGGLLELGAIEQPFNLAGDGVCGHNERVKRVDVFACHRAFGIPNQCRDHFGKAEIVGDTCEAVAQNVGRFGQLILRHNWV